MLSNNYREYLMASTEDDDSKINDPDESVHSESENIEDSEKELSEIEILQKNMMKIMMLCFAPQQKLKISRKEVKKK